MPKLTIDQFKATFFHLTKNWSWEVQGFLDSNSFVHPIDSDTKVISTVFERMAAPAIRSIAREYGYTVELANQTTYPDFTMTNIAESHRIALDIKTTYTRPRMGFTLGSYNSFLRNGIWRDNLGESAATIRMRSDRRGDWCLPVVIDVGKWGYGF